MNIEKMARLDRQELIRRLKTAKDPRERDRILLLLSDREGATQSAQAPPGQTSPAPEGEPSPTQLRIGKLIGYAFPLFFLIAGAVFTIEMLAEVGNGKPLREALMENPTGIFLIFFGLLGLLKNKKSRNLSKT